MSFPTFRSRSRLGAPLTAALAAGLVLGSGALVLGGQAAPAQAADAPASAVAAATWLEDQIATNGSSLPGFAGPDIGLTEDAVLALTAAGFGEHAVTRDATGQIAAHITDFVSFDNFGVPGVHLAGGLAKSLLVAEVQGADPTSFGGRNLEQELRATRIASGASAGRFADQGTADTSNGFSQALGILGLVRTSDGVPSDAVGFLLAQQCPSGAFRLFYDTGSSCTDNAQADADATGLAVQALAALTPSTGISAAIADAVAWTKARQNPATGSFNGSGPTDVPNANSTGLSVVLLRLAGEDAAADKGQAYLEGLQLASGADVGALAYDPAARAAATGGTIPGSDLDQWRRATAQAILGLGLPSYGQIVAVAANPSSSSSTTSTTSSSSSSSTSPTSASTTSTTTQPGATVLGEQTSNAGGLAATGGLPVRLVLLGLIALLLGVAVTAAATDRAAKHR